MFSILKKWFRRSRREKPGAAPDAEAAPHTGPPKPSPAAPAEEKRALPAQRPQDLAPEASNTAPAALLRLRKPREKRPKPSRPPSGRNRHGIPVFKPDAEIAGLFDLRGEAPPEESDAPPRALPKAAPSRPGKGRLRNRHGIPFFEEHTDFSVYFKDAPQAAAKPRRDGGGTESSVPADPEAATFRRLLEASLADKTREGLLLEKRGAVPERPPVTAEQAIRGYPPPQEELDLHGQTAREAIDGTRAFVDKSRYRGKRTLLIIVGKGLHSDGKAILPDVVEAELARLRQEGKVLAHRWERGAKRKSGAIVVYLNPM